MSEEGGSSGAAGGVKHVRAHPATKLYEKLLADNDYKPDPWGFTHPLEKKFFDFATLPPIVETLLTTECEGKFPPESKTPTTEEEQEQYKQTLQVIYLRVLDFVKSNRINLDGVKAYCDAFCRKYIEESERKRKIQQQQLPAVLGLVEAAPQPPPPPPPMQEDKAPSPQAEQNTTPQKNMMAECLWRVIKNKAKRFEGVKYPVTACQKEKWACKVKLTVKAVANEAKKQKITCPDDVYDRIDRFYKRDAPRLSAGRNSDARKALAAGKHGKGQPKASKPKRMPGCSSKAAQEVVNVSSDDDIDIDASSAKLPGMAIYETESESEDDDTWMTEAGSGKKPQPLSARH